jgi:hypothetical protein
MANVSSTRAPRKQVALYLDPATQKQLQRLSERTRVPQQVFLREGVDLVLKKYRGAK